MIRVLFLVIREREHEWQEMMKRRKEKFKRRSVRFIDPKGRILSLKLFFFESFVGFFFRIGRV